MKHAWRAPLAAVLLATAPAPAAELLKPDRTIRKEPTYVSKQPRYCLLVFGPEAKARTWLVVDDDFLYADRNGNGDLTEPGERVAFDAFRRTGAPPMEERRDAEAGDVREGKLRHERLRVTQIRVKKGFVPKARWEEELKALTEANGEALVYSVMLSLEIRPRPGDPIRIAGRIMQSAGMDAAGFLQFADSPKAAPVIHFRGPLQMGLNSPQRLTLGPDPAELQTVVGTPGQGKGTFASVSYSGLIGDDAQPVAEVEFPALSRGSPPFKVRFELPHRC